MKVARKRLLFLSLVLLVGTQPIINYTSEGNSPLASPSFTKLLFAGINSLFAYATSIAFSTYVSGWVQKYMMQQKKKIQEHQLKNIEQGQIKKPIPVKTTITFKDYIGVPKEAIQLVSQLK